MKEEVNWLDILRVRQKVELIVPSDSRKRVSKAIKANDSKDYISCLSRIEGISDKGFEISLPSCEGKPIESDKDNIYYMRVVASRIPYGFESTLLKVINTGVGMPIWLMATPMKMRRTQFRSFARADVSMPIFIAIKNKDGQWSEPELQVQTRDLSGGGLAFYSRQGFLSGTEIKLRIRLDANNEVYCTAVVSRVLRKKNELDFIFRVAVKFIDLSEGDLQKIIRKIWQVQAERIRLLDASDEFIK